MNRHRRNVIKSSFVTCSSVVMSNLLVLDCVLSSYDGDDPIHKNIKKRRKLLPQEIIEETINDLNKKDGFADLVRLSVELNQNGQLEIIGGIENMFSLCDRYNLYAKFN